MKAKPDSVKQKDRAVTSYNLNQQEKALQGNDYHRPVPEQRASGLILGTERPPKQGLTLTGQPVQAIRPAA